MARCEKQNGQSNQAALAAPRGRQAFASEETQSQCQRGLKSLLFACLLILTSLAVSLEEAGVGGGSQSQLRSQTIVTQELCRTPSLKGQM